MKTLKNLLFPIVALLVMLTVACSKDDDKPASSSHKVVFKAIGNTNAKIQSIVYGYDDKITSHSDVNTATWTSPEVTTPAGTLMVNMNVTALAPDASGNLKVQIFVDGELKKENVATGSALVGAVSYTF
ncbi:hypothetical protein LX64_00828 [Chitinophaga skermanii]|uniref:MmpS family membrane protein n=1 Tax=Chitinophaga skermanii TaxID=331697 RepID=A0A327QV47_9BACT|nr:hypothetical protein [Chitinophaga skermanii]RAJ08181.1 hypothetical protein LX64_00828 [Chitinophaga skermanii]